MDNHNHPMVGKYLVPLRNKIPILFQEQEFLIEWTNRNKVKLDLEFLNQVIEGVLIKALIDVKDLEIMLMRFLVMPV